MALTKMPKTEQAGCFFVLLKYASLLAALIYSISAIYLVAAILIFNRIYLILKLCTQVDNRRNREQQPNTNTVEDVVDITNQHK